MDGKKVICGISERRNFYIFDADPPLQTETPPDSGEKDAIGTTSSMHPLAAKREWRSAASLRNDYDIEVWF